MYWSKDKSFFPEETGFFTEERRGEALGRDAVSYHKSER
jgi:hypothetical protein